MRRVVSCEAFVGGKCLGMNAERRGRSEGRHATMMLTLVSTDERLAAGGLSNVGSVEFEIDTRACSRTTEMVQTL